MVVMDSRGQERTAVGALSLYDNEEVLGEEEGRKIQSSRSGMVAGTADGRPIPLVEREVPCATNYCTQSLSS